MKNITYLFGAGASRNAVPIVSEFQDRIEEIIFLLQKDEYKLSEEEKYNDIDSTLTKREIQIEFIEDLKWLSKECKNHASVDTLAKKLSLKQDRNLKKLKAVLSAYLIFEQSRNPTDKRYDSFFASILTESTHRFPQQLRILSWNYDYQFEKAYSDYSDYSSISDNQSRLNVIAKHTYNNDTGFGIYKINGVIGIYQYSKRQHYPFLLDKININSLFDKKLIEAVLRNWKVVFTLGNDVYPTLSFAWEKFEHENQNIIDKCILGTKETNILIVIGYSFPFFNREIDRKILGAETMTKLEKVYFQAPDAQLLKERFLGIRDDLQDNKLVTRFDIDQFLLPNEL